MGAVRLGIRGKLFLEVVRDVASFAETEVTNCRDLTLTMELQEGDATTRGNGGFKATVGTLADVGIEFEMLELDDAVLDQLRIILLSRELGTFTVLDREDGEGPKFTGQVLAVKQGQPLNGVVTNSVTVKLTTFTEWIEGEPDPE